MWRGVPFATLVEQVQPVSQVNTVVLSAHNGTTVSLPLSALQNALLALETHAHTRLIVPGLPVCSLPFGITHITLTSQSGPPPAPLASRVWVEARTADDAVSGLAYRGVDGLEGVSVRLNHGPAVPLAISAPEGRITRWRLPLPGGFSGMLHVSAEPVVSQVRA
jgi:DMSO/TMAO reductase YedYZ molybdopterin-dependent catalytic subunit